MPSSAASSSCFPCTHNTENEKGCAISHEINQSSQSSFISTTSFEPVEECFLLKKQNKGFQIPFFLSSHVELEKIRPPAVVKTWDTRYEELGSENQQIFDEFRTKVESKPWYNSDLHDNWCLIRYLTARNFNCTKALEQLQETVEWLKNPENSSTECSLCQKDPDLHCGQFVGWDLSHRPVMFMSMRWGPERKHPLNHMIAAFNHLTKLMPLGVEKWVCLTDFETYSHLKDSNPSMGISVIQTIQTHFPERLGKMICINPPTLFWVLWNLFSPFVDPPTKEKVEFLYTEDRPSTYDSFSRLFPEHLCQYLHDAFDRSKYGIKADPLVWYPSSDAYPSNFEERKRQLKDIKNRLKACRKEGKEEAKRRKKNDESTASKKK